MAITENAQSYHEKMFPGYVSKCQSGGMIS